MYTHGVGRLERLLQLEPGTLELDAPLPADLPPESAIEGAKSRYTLVVELARRERLTVRQLIGRLGGGRGHLTFAGTPEQVADEIETWFTRGAADGFNIMPAGPAVRPRRLRRPRRPDPARPRSAPHRVRPAPDPAGALRPAAPRQPARQRVRTRPAAHPAPEPAEGPRTSAPKGSRHVPSTSRRSPRNIGARVSGVDISKPLDEETVAALREALNVHKALVFDDVNLDDETQQAFVRHFGDITTAHPTVAAVDGAPNVLPVDSERARANHWHTDVTFVLNPPQATTLRSITIPPYGGETLIAELGGRLPGPARAAAAAGRRPVGRAHQRLRLRGAATRRSTRSGPSSAPGSPRSSTARPTRSSASTR